MSRLRRGVEGEAGSGPSHPGATWSRQDPGSPPSRPGISSLARKCHRFRSFLFKRDFLRSGERASGFAGGKAKGSGRRQYARRGSNERIGLKASIEMILLAERLALMLCRRLIRVFRLAPPDVRIQTFTMRAGGRFSGSALGSGDRSAGSHRRDPSEYRECRGNAGCSPR